MRDNQSASKSGDRHAVAAMKVASINLLGMCALVGSAEITFEVSALTQQLFFAQLWELTWRFFADPVNGGNRDKRGHMQWIPISRRAPLDLNGET
jgi:hypothetical protein